MTCRQFTVPPLRLESFSISAAISSNSGSSAMSAPAGLPPGIGAQSVAVC
jgi:hypothetical protein